MLKWALHIVTLVDFYGDPLSKDLDGVRPHYMFEKDWLFVEYLENGRILDFVNRVNVPMNQLHSTHLPNRMLWRIFMCREFHPRSWRWKRWGGEYAGLS